MIKLLIKLFIKDYKNTSESAVRERYGVLGGILGIVCNALLFVIKLAAGSMIGSIAVISDAFNNLSDLGSSIVSVIGAKLSNRRPDREHPFGHGRFEYIASLIVSFIILLMGVELFKSSFIKIIKPEAVTLSTIPIIILLASILIKLWMFSFNRYLGKKISSGILSAAAADSISDVFSTGAVLISAIIGNFTSLPVDGIAGVAVSLMIIKTGFSIARETVDLLLGSSPDPETTQLIHDEILTGKGIIGVHDLVVHDYGPGRIMASAHAEVPDTAELVEIHEVINEVEERVLSKTGIVLVLHMDPISVDCVETQALKELASRKAAEINPCYTIHDFRITRGQNRIDVIFDLVLPPELSQSERDKISKKIIDSLCDEDDRLCVRIKIDSSYI